MTPTSATQERSEQATDKNAIRPFHVSIPEAELTELRRRVNATKWPERETVTDASQGVQLATIQKLARCWATDYDWRKCEARLNALPQFNGIHDGMIPVSNSHALGEHLPNAVVLTYPESGHGSLFQFHESFARQAISCVGLSILRPTEPPRRLS
jgi:pimeloyl-ACP methyl ester carboxylesterase